MAAGVAVIGTSVLIGGITMLPGHIAIKYLEYEMVKGNLKGDKFVCWKDIKELSQLRFFVIKSSYKVIMKLH